jgi:two-component system chemotaxis response regulator CheY
MRLSHAQRRHHLPVTSMPARSCATGSVTLVCVFDDHSLSVLVVDDDAEVRAATADLLEEAGYLTIDAQNGLEALEILKRGVRPLAMLIDLHMPQMDGEQLCGACACDPRFATIPRIVVSGHRDGPARVKRCGAVGFLAKPIDWHRLWRTLDGLDEQLRRR